MAEATQLEETVKAAPKEEKVEEKKKPVTTLESVVNESLHGVKSLFNLGLAGLIPATQAALVPTAARDTAILTGAQIAADATTDYKKGKKFTSTDWAKSSAVGTAITLPVHYLFDVLNKIPLDSALGYVGRASMYGGIVYPVYIGAYQFFDYTIKNMSFNGVGIYIKENYLPVLKRAWKTTIPLGLANILLIPAYLQIPIAALLGYAFALFGAPKKEEVPEEMKREKTPYLAAASKAFGKLSTSLIYAPFRALYEIGSGLNRTIAPRAFASAPA